MLALVTGVQTCALPIWPARNVPRLLPCDIGAAVDHEALCGGRAAGGGRAVSSQHLHRRQARPAAARTPQRFSRCAGPNAGLRRSRSEEHTSELQSLMRISYAVFCLKKKTIM